MGSRRAVAENGQNRGPLLAASSRRFLFPAIDHVPNRVPIALGNAGLQTFSFEGTKFVPKMLLDRAIGELPVKRLLHNLA